MTRIQTIQRLDFDKVAPKLYQGGAVMPSHGYSEFTMIVLCAVEYQPEMPAFRGQIVRAAFADTSRPSSEDLARALKAALFVATELRRGGRVLVTCWQGLNRSGLVTGLALAQISALEGERVVDIIRAYRSPDALCNETFERIVRDFADQRNKRKAPSSELHSR